MPPPRHSDIYITDVYSMSEHGIADSVVDKASCDSVTLFKQVREVTGEFLEPSEVLQQIVPQQLATTGQLRVVVCVEYAVSHVGGTVSELTSVTCMPCESSVQLPPANRHHARLSHASSTSSGSSMASSASTLARRLAASRSPLTHERIGELRDRWINSHEVWRLLDYVDRCMADSSTMTEPPQPQLSQINEETDNVCTRRAPKVKFAMDADDMTLRTNETTPRKKQKRGAAVAVVATNGHASPVPAGYSASASYSRGDRVFAKWTDRKFYAATLVERAADGRWTVDFYDGDRRAVAEENMVVASEPALIGQRVYAAHQEDDFTVGIVTGCDQEYCGLMYSVARDDRDIRVPADQILLTESQARQVRSRCGLAVVARGTFGTDDGHRTTRSRTRALACDSPVPGSSGTQHQQQRRGRRGAAGATATATPASKQHSDSEDDSSTCATAACNGLDPYAYVPGIEPEAPAAYDGCGRVKGKAVAGKMRFGDLAASTLGPLPPAGRLPFDGLHVLLTCSRPTVEQQSPSDAASTTSSASNNENYRFSSAPCVVSRLREQLEAGGARVHARFDDLPPRHYRRAYLVANRPSCTARYLQCLAAGVRAVCHEWVIRCCAEGRALPPQDLPCGWSVELERFVSWYERPCEGAATTTARPLRRKHVLVAADDGDFLAYWTRVLELAEAHVRPLATAADAEVARALCVLCECGHRDERTDRALYRGVPLVTTTWLVQTLVHGQLRDFQRLPCYKPDYLDFD